MDVKSAFLHGDLYEEIYMEKTPSCVTDSNLGFRLQKSLYGLKQAPQAWYEKIYQFFVNLGFNHCEYDHSIYLLHVKGDTFIVAIYADDLVLTRNNLDLIFILKS